jgi:hypothetical protein
MMLLEYHKSIHAPTVIERRSYEVHPRIQFNHRGQAAMALPSNQVKNSTSTCSTTIENDTFMVDWLPQFFIRRMRLPI